MIYVSNKIATPVDGAQGGAQKSEVTLCCGALCGTLCAYGTVAENDLWSLQDSDSCGRAAAYSWSEVTLCCGTLCA